MLVKCVKRFRDFEAGTFREVGATFEVNAKRYHEINATRYGQLIEKVEDKPSESVSEPSNGNSEQVAPKRRGRPKKTVETND